MDPPDLAKISGIQPSSFPSSIRPMLASLAKKPFSDSNWLFEPKLDGYRTLAFIRNGEAKLVSRNGLIVSQKYPDLIQKLNKQETQEMVLDGEVMALNENGRSCFQCLQDHWNRKTLKGSDGTNVKHSIIYYVFDILHLNGYDLRNVPLYQRKNLLASTLSPSGNVRSVEYFENDGLALYEASIKLGLEGVIAKLRDSIYEQGLRSHNWLKVKSIQSDEFVIGGYTQGTGNRANTFGALLLGSYDDKGQLVFVGHVGSGFDEKKLAELQLKMDAIRIEDDPFIATPPLNGPVTWVKPELVAEVKFAEKTQEGYLRIPIFLRLREDKSPAEVHLNETSPDQLVDDSRKRDSSSPGNGILEEILEQLINKRDNFDIEHRGL